MSVSEQNTKLFLLDNNVPYRASLVTLLAANDVHVEPHSSIDEFQNHVELSAGGCILLDAGLPNKSALKLHRSLKDVSAIWPIVYLGDCPDVRVVIEVMKLGAVDFLTKPVHVQSVLDSLRLAMSVHASNSAIFCERDHLHRRLRLLNSRELQVLELLVYGWLNKQIAAHLEVSVRTIETRRAAIQQKLQLRSIVEIIWEIGRFDFELNSLPVPMYNRLLRIGTPPFSPAPTETNAKIKWCFNSHLSAAFNNRQSESMTGTGDSTPAEPFLPVLHTGYPQQIA